MFYNVSIVKTIFSNEFPHVHDNLWRREPPSSRIEESSGISSIPQVPNSHNELANEGF